MTLDKDNGAHAVDRPQRRREYAVDLAAFLLAFGFAIAYRWTPEDIVFGLWVSSLVAGGTVVSLPWLLGFLFPEFAQIPVEQRRFQYGVARAIVFCVMLGTFVAFHFGYLAALDTVVRAPGPATQVMMQSTSGLVAALGEALRCVAELLGLYWPIVAGSVVVALQKFWSDVRTMDDDVILGPWKLVARLHILIFVFFLLHGLGVRSALAAVAFIILYFPIDRPLWRRLQKRGTR